MFSGRGFAATKIPNGQQLYGTAGTYSLVVPAYVTALSAALVAGGGGGSSTTGGNGGNLRYKNNIPVTPGETLTIVVGAGGGAAYGSPSSGGVTQIKRGSTVILDTNSVIGSVADGGGNGGLGSYGNPASSPNGNITNGGGGGGAAGYAGNGGNGDDYNPAPAGGGGKGGQTTHSDSFTWDSTSPYYGTSEGWDGTDGGGVGLKGQGASGVSYSQPGSGGLGNSYGGGGAGGFTSAGSTNRDSAGHPGGSGGARLIWGQGRAYPSTLTGDLT